MWSRWDARTVPEPYAASMASMWWPAEAQTRSPACSLATVAIASALRRRSASPVRMTTPVSMSSGATRASAYASSRITPSASASICMPSANGVNRTSDWKCSSRRTTTYLLVRSSLRRRR